MRKIRLVFGLVLFLSVTFQVNAQWFWQNPLPTPYDLNSGFFVSSNVGWMVGDYGTILKSTNGGLSWAKQNYNTNKNLTTVYFLSENIGFIGGDEILLRTSNGGSMWEEIDAPLPRFVKGILFINDTLGYLFGVNNGAGHIHRTTDQGLNWTYDILYPQIHQYIGSINSIVKTDCHNLWAVNTGGKILRSYDRGYDWQIIDDSSLIFSQNSITAINNDTAWIVGGDYGNLNRILKTTNGGQDFVIQLSGGYGYLNSIKFFNDSSGITVGNDGRVLITDNGGQGWDYVDLGITQNLNDIIIINTNTSFVIGDRGTIYKSTNKGVDWIKISLGSVNQITNVSFIDNNNGLAVGCSDLLTTSDGGESWQIKNTSICSKSIFRFDSQTYLSLTNYGDVYLSEDNGNNWINLTSSIPVLNSIYFTDRYTGWAVGGYSVYVPHYWEYFGYVYKTTNGGTSWAKQDTILDNILNDVYFIDENFGWAAGNLLFMRTTDGGSNWTKSSNHVINSVFFLDHNVGYSAGSQTGINKIFKTTDGGVSWIGKEFYGGTELYSIYFSSYQNGWVVGDFGTIGHTSDVGETWTRIERFTNLDLFDVFFINDSVGWITGDNGLVIKTTNGGVTFIEEEKIFAQPTEFLLQQNYPNPFNPSTKISWQVPVSGWQTLKVYDILGNEVATLVDEYRNAGSYEVDFPSVETLHATSLPSGVYFYRLRVGDFTETKKMILLK